MPTTQSAALRCSHLGFENFERKARWKVFARAVEATDQVQLGPVIMRDRAGRGGRPLKTNHCYKLPPAADIVWVIKSFPEKGTIGV